MSVVSKVCVCVCVSICVNLYFLYKLIKSFFLQYILMGIYINWVSGDESQGNQSIKGQSVLVRQVPVGPDMFSIQDQGSGIRDQGSGIGHPGIRSYTKYRDASGAIRTGRVKLDSHSNVNYSLHGTQSMGTQ